MTPPKHIIAILLLVLGGCDRPAPVTDAPRQGVGVPSHPPPPLTGSSQVGAVAAAPENPDRQGLYDPSTVDQAPGWHEAQHPYTWPPDDKFWDIRRFKVRDPRADDESMELFPDFPRQDRIMQKRAFSLKPEDFDAHCAAEEKAGRVGLLMVEPQKYAFCVKSANGLWVAVPGKPVKTRQELWPTIAKSVGPENEGDLYPIIGGAVQDPTLGVYGTGPGETDQ